MGISKDDICPFDLFDCEFPTDSDTLAKMDKLLHSSPMKYVDSKINYMVENQNGKYINLLDYFKRYNELDVEILMSAWSNLAESFWNMFSQNILLSWSLPGVAQNILLSKYDPESPPVYTFPNEYGFLNKEIRRNICGGFSGPITLRHVELDATEQKFDKSVYFNKDGEKYTQIRQDDANSLYPSVMLGEMPTGLGVYLRKSESGFNPELIAGKKFPRYSEISLQYMDMIQGTGFFIVPLNNTGKNYTPK